MTPNLSDLRAKLRECAGKAEPKVWYFDCGNQQVEGRPGRMPIADICERWDLAGKEDYIAIDLRYTNGEFIATANHASILQLLDLLDRFEGALREMYMRRCSEKQGCPHCVAAEALSGGKGTF
jgi:hypothetical protein